MSPAGSGGVVLQLLTESFAVRALLGSLATVGIALVAVRVDLLSSTRGRRLLVLTPVLTAAAAGVATAWDAGTYLPQLWVTTDDAATGYPLLDLIEELRGVTLSRPLDLLVVAYAGVVAVLLARRLLGAVAVQRMLRRGAPPTGAHRRVLAAVRPLCARMGLAVPRVLLVPSCPGGAFALGSVRPTVAVDPALVDALDDRELEGLIAHELAHLRRQDPLLCLAVGLFRDATFFLPTVAIGTRWLHREQEESADDIASRVTSRPASLASAILEVWNRSAATGPRVACAAVGGGGRVALAGAGADAGLPWRRHARRRPAAIVTRRVERLIAGQPVVSRGRRDAEVVFAVVVVAVGVAAGTVLPGWVAANGANALAFGYFPSQPEVEEESMAFSTFRQLTRATPESLPAVPAATVAAAPAPTAAAAGCPCVETRAQLRAGAAATASATDPWLRWSRGGSDPYEVVDRTRDGIPDARPLVVMNQDGPQVGVFVVQDRPPLDAAGAERSRGTTAGTR